MRLSDYNIEKSFTSTNGDCYIATSKLDGKKYFIKRNTDVSYGSDSDPIELRRKYKKDADEWLNYHNLIRKEFTKLGNGTGTTVFPIAYFVDEGKVYELAHYVEINKLAVSDADKSKPTDKKISELSSSDKIRILQTSSYALKSIHALGIVHCDLKPDNVPISKSEMGGYISKITDCGDAIFVNNIPQEGQIVCTEPYWSPELASYKRGNESIKNRLNSKNDVFAMGLIFHEWWTGDFPYYDGRDDFVCLYQVVHKSWPNKIKVDDGVPLWLKDLILDMVYPEPEGRPTMDTVFEAIKSNAYTPIPRGNKTKKSSKLSYDILKSVMSKVPSDDDSIKYTDESFNSLKKCVSNAKNNLSKLTTQQQVDKLACLIDEAINALEIKQESNFKKIEEAIAQIESKDLSKYTKESREQLDKYINFAKAQKSNLTDNDKITQLHAAIIRAYKNLILENVPFIVADPLPAPYTKVEILSSDYVIAYYGSGKIKLSADNAVKMKLIKRK